METNLEAEEPPPPATPEPLPEAEPAPEPASENVLEAEPTGEDPAAGGSDELGQLAEAAARARLSGADEERLVALLKEALLGGRGGVARAIEVLPKLPWIVGVRGVEQVWPELTNGFRTQLLAGLAKEESDPARRMRLSLARALFKLDVSVALKVALGVLKDLREKETGALSAKNAQIISNVFIGRGKPWLAQLPLEELKPAEVDLLVHCAVLAAFSVPHPPVTQLGVLKWAQEAGRLDKLQEPALEAVVRNLARWSAKWQGALRKELPELPEAIATALKPVTATEPNRGEADPGNEMAEPEMSEAKDETAGDPDADAEPDEEPRRKERPVYEPRPQKSPAETREREVPQERPVYTPRGAAGQRNFNLNEALKGIESHVQSLRNELAAAQAKARLKEDDRRPRRAEKIGPIIEGEPTPEELARLNLQLEARNHELQARIEDLAQHSEDLATSVGAMAGEPVSDAAAQLRTLLGLKLQEDFADFSALEQESHDLVVQQHYRMIIRHVFEVLREAQVPLNASSHEPG
ncbi:MAG: hypothetical protein QOE70_1998 [Chthoniobacter sp.]|jgi:hypothetical protein|nr:hypothetical protein [Chthoniobacter sp.]